MNLDGSLNVDPIKFSHMFTKTVLKNNGTSGKITVPKDFVGNEVIILVPAEKIQPKKGEN